MGLVDINKFKLLPLTKLRKAQWNYKVEDEELAAKLVANIKRNGQIENIIVRQLDEETYEVVNGNHRMDALQAMGAQEVVCYDLGAATEQEAYRISIETNETKFATDNVKLSTLIAQLAKDVSMEGLQATMPYSDKELDAFVKMCDFDWNKYNDDSKDAQGDKDGDGNATQAGLTITLPFDAAQEFLEAKQLYDSELRNDQFITVLLEGFSHAPPD